MWERINRLLMEEAHGGRVEGGRTVRIDSTVTETHIRKPTDSQRLCDGVRVLTRLLVHARDELGAEAFPFHNHRRAAKRWALRASWRRGKRRVAAYRELLGIARRTLGYRHGALAAVGEREAPALRNWQARALRYGELLGRVVDQTERSVLRGEKVPAQEKVASLFEPHPDIIVKGGRQVQYGHKVNLSTGASGLVLDAVVERGNPVDSSRCLTMIERHAEIYGTVPEQVACDAGYASKRNLREARRLASPTWCRAEEGAAGGGHGIVTGRL